MPQTSAEIAVVTSDKVNQLVQTIDSMIHDHQIVKIKNDLQSITKNASDMEISDANTKGQASDELGFLKKFQKDLDKRRLELLKPYNEAAKRLKTKIDGIIEEAKKAEQILSTKISAYITHEQIEAEKKRKQEQERIRQDMEKKMLELQDQADTEQIDLTEAQNRLLEDAAVQMDRVKKYGQVKEKARGQAFTTHQQEVWVIEITDPKEFLLWVAKDVDKRIQYIRVKDDGFVYKSELNKLAGRIQKEAEGNGMRCYKEYRTVTR